MELRSHSCVSRHLVAIHGIPMQDKGNVSQKYYSYVNITKPGPIEKNKYLVWHG
jgi:hypothetical protein